MSTTLLPPTNAGNGPDGEMPMGPARASRRPGGDSEGPERTAEPQLARRGRFTPDTLLLTAAIGIVAVLVKLAWPRFTWFGDNAESFFPLWHMVGTALREGRWLGFDPTGWAGGNIVGESAYGMFNPVTLLNALFISGFDELARASFFVMTEFLVLLGLGVRLLALAYGARRSAAFTAGLIVPFGGFTLYWGAGNWASGLMAVTWLVWAWWAARRYASGLGGPLPFVICAGLAVTVGNPYSLLGVLVVLTGLAVELARGRQFRRLGGLVVAGLCVGGIALLTYLPLVHALPVGDRGDSAGITNGSYLAPSLGDLVGLSSPTMIPEINAWADRTDKVPSVYLSWLVLPLLPWVHWRPAGEWRNRLGLLLPTAVFGLMTLGPDRIWMFRWPLRMIEYSWVGLTVCFAILLSAGLARDYVRRRATATALVVGGGFFLAFSSTPSDVGAHLLWTTVVGGLVAGTLIAIRRRGLRALPVMAVVGTLLITPAQAAVHGWDYRKVAPDLDLGRVSDLASVREETESYRGTVYQMADIKLIEDPEATRSGRLTFGHMLAASGHETVNRYTGISFKVFMENLSLNYRGSVREDWPVDILYSDVPGYDTRIIDALGIDTLVLASRGFEASEYAPRAGWRTILRDEHRTVLQRREIPPPGPQVTPGAGVEVLAAEDTGLGSRLTVSSAEGGTVLLDRLAWAGYSAATDSGAAVEVASGPLGLLEVTVPPGTTVIDIAYEVPGLRTGLIAVAMSFLVALAHQLLWRRRSAAPAGPAVAVAHATPTPSAPVTLPSQESMSTPSHTEASHPTT